MARRRSEEFWCDPGGQGCGKYFLTYLREDEFGNFIIECPNCQHHHFRTIKDGIPTSDRFNKSLPDPTVIVGLVSTVRDTPWHDDPIFRRSQLRAYERAGMT